MPFCECRRPQPSGGRDNFRVEKRDKSKAIQKGGPKGAPKQISLEKLRAEGDSGARRGKKFNLSKGGKFGDKRGKKPFVKRGGFKGGSRDGKPLPKDPTAKKEFLDRELDSYWVKGGHTEIGKYTIIRLTRYFFSTCSSR